MKPIRVPVVHWEQSLRDAHPMWRYQAMEDDVLAVTVTDMDMDYLILCAVEEACYAAEYAFPFLVPADRRDVVGKLLHTVNRRLLLAAFSLDYSTGLVTCAARHLCGESVPDDAWLNQIVESVPDAVVAYGAYVIAAACYGFDTFEL